MAWNRRRKAGGPGVPAAPATIGYSTGYAPINFAQQYQWAPFVVIGYTINTPLPYQVHIEADYGSGFGEIASFNGSFVGYQEYGDGGASFDSPVRYRVRIKKNGIYSAYAGPTALFTPRRYLPYGIFAFSDQPPRKVIDQADADSTALIGLGSYGTRAAPLIKAKITISTETKVAADTANYSQFFFADQIIKTIPSGGFSVDGEWAANGGSPGVTPTGQNGASGGGGATNTTGVVGGGGTGGMGGSGTNGSNGDDPVNPGIGGVGYGSAYDYPDAVKGGDGGGNYNQGSVASGATGFGGGGGGGGAPGGSQPGFTPGGGGGGAGQFTAVTNYFWDSSGSGIFIGARGGPGADSSAGTFSAGAGGGGGSVNIATKANSANGGSGNIYVDGGTPGVDFYGGAYAQPGTAGAIGFWMISQDDSTQTLSDQGTFWDNNYGSSGPP